ncbi:MAG: S8 family serine peptidase, partial [Bacteroidota bacterium]
DGFAGSNDADCNAPQAWDISLGSSSITVAVIDDGVEDHEDLGNVLSGYTPLTNGDGSPNASGAHGQSCAGIIAALHNGIGVAGLAPNVNILPVNIFAGDETNFETTQDLANAIRWAVDNGADVLSNSWGYPNSCGAQASNINSALQYAITNGRGGLGAIVVFSSGNDGATCVNYPAWRPEVVAVGAFGNDGIVSEYSNQGSNLDITAPSDDVRVTRFGNFRVGAGVRTIDREGSAGYDAGNYNPGFGGTSAACPVVSGVAALVLSVNPSLTESEVKNILYNTAIDMGANGFDNVYGNGRVNAFAAVQAAGGSNSNTPPVASFNADPTSGTAPLTVSFDASGSSDADGDGLSYSWNFGDGNSGSGLSPSHTYQNAGTFTATLTVDDGQATDQSSVQITVGEPSGGGPEVISANSFETGWEDWNDGGEDCARPNNATWAFDGDRSIRLRNGTSTSLTFSDPFDLAGYNSVEVDFYFVPRGMESTDSFSLQYNDGGGWQTVATFVRGNGYVNNSFYNETVTITSSSVNLTNGASFRFVNAGNARNDRVFLDLITITGSSSLSSLSLNNNVSAQPRPVQAISARDFQGAESVEDVVLYPNPVSEMLRIKNLPDDTKIEIFNSLGQKVMTVNDEDELNMEKLERGLYVVKITRKGEVRITRINKR